MSEEKGQLDIFYEKLSDQDFKQKVGMYLAFIMEFYRVLMGSFLLVFVPQKCGDDICGMFENVVTENPVTNTAFAGNILMFTLFLCMYYCELSRENKMINYKTILDDEEGIFQEDIKQWHYVTPIQTLEDGMGFRDILGVDIILNT